MRRQDTSEHNDPVRTFIAKLNNGQAAGRSLYDPPVRIKQDDTKGRCVFATIDITTGMPLTLFPIGDMAPNENNVYVIPQEIPFSEDLIKVLYLAPHREDISKPNTQQCGHLINDLAICPNLLTRKIDGTYGPMYTLADMIMAQKEKSFRLVIEQAKYLQQLATSYTQNVEEVTNVVVTKERIATESSQDGIIFNVRATRYIKKDSELSLKYGLLYWLTLQSNTHDFCATNPLLDSAISNYIETDEVQHIVSYLQQASAEATTKLDRACPFSNPPKCGIFSPQQYNKGHMPNKPAPAEYAPAMNHKEKNFL